MLAQHVETSACLPARGESDEPNDSAVRLPSDDREFRKVLVEGDKDLPLSYGGAEDLLVTGIFGPGSHPRNLVTGFSDLVTGPAPDAGVEEQLHVPPSTTAGSTR